MQKKQVISFCLLLLPLLLGGATPPSMGEYDVKALFLYKFTRYITWPESTWGEEFRIGILGESEIRGPLETIADQEKVGDKPIVLKFWDTPEEIEDCHILFIARDRKLDPLVVRNQVGERPVLTVGEWKGYANEGIILNFVMKENKVRFELNQQALATAGLTASSQLLKLAILIETE